MEYTTEQINDLARDMCFYSDKCGKDCCALNCETTWIAKKALASGWRKPTATDSKYTVEQYQRVLAKAADMKAAIDELQEMTRIGIDSWADFGKALDAIYKARDEYYNTQLDISVKTYLTPNF